MNITVLMPKNLLYKTDELLLWVLKKNNKRKKIKIQFHEL